MSFNKKILPRKRVLEEYLKEHGSKSFYWRWIKSVDAFIGSNKSVNFIDSFQHKYHSNATNYEFNQMD